MSASKGYGGPSIHRYTHKTISDVGSGGDQGGGGNAGGGASVAGGGGGSPRGGVPKPNIAWVKVSASYDTFQNGRASSSSDNELFTAESATVNESEETSSSEARIRDVWS